MSRKNPSGSKVPSPSVSRHVALAVLGVTAFSVAGCGWVPRHRLAASESENRSLVEQTRAQLAQIENFKVRHRQMEEHLAQAEEELARLDQEQGPGGKRLVNFRRGNNLPSALADHLVGLSNRYPALEYDPETGISKFDTDVLFDSGEAELRPEARELLSAFAKVIQTSEAEDLRFMIVGHTDDRQVSKRPTRERYPNNWHLSAARSLAVADFLRSQGVPERRLGVAGFGAEQPLARNESSADRQRNRRVEIFVLGPDTPLVGWVDSTPSLY